MKIGDISYNSSIPELIDWLQDIDTPNSVTPAQLAYILRKIYAKVSVIEKMASDESIEIMNEMEKAVHAAESAINSVQEMSVVLEKTLKMAEQPARFFYKIEESIQNDNIRERTDSKTARPVWSETQKNFLAYLPGDPTKFYRSWPSSYLYENESGDVINRGIYLLIGSGENGTVASAYTIYGDNLIKISELASELAELGVSINVNFNNIYGNLSDINNAIAINQNQISSLQTSVDSNIIELEKELIALKPQQFTGIIEKDLGGLIVPSHKYGIPTMQHISIQDNNTLLPVSEIWFDMQTNAFVGSRGSEGFKQYFTKWNGDENYNEIVNGIVKAKSSVEFKCGSSVWEMSKSGFHPVSVAIIDYADFNKLPFVDGVPQLIEGYYIDEDLTNAIRTANSLKIISTNGTITLPINRVSGSEFVVEVHTAAFKANGNSYYGILTVSEDMEFCLDFSII